MAQIAIEPLVLKNLTLTIDVDDYAKHVDKVELTPSASAVTWTGGGGNTHTDTTPPTWTATIQYAQDWNTPNSLSRYLFEHEGEKKTVTFEPTADGPGFTVDVIITPGAIGGAVGSFATTSVTLGCDGRPLLVDPTP